MVEWLTVKVAFALVSFSLGELGDGLNIFQGIYLVGLGWNEGAVGIALSLMGLTALIVQTIAGDIVDKTTSDRRNFLAMASIFTALSASAILFVREGNEDHALIFITKIIEGIASSFIAPCLAALTLANFGPERFDEIMASNILWGHIGSVVSAVFAGSVAYAVYPDIKYCFLVIGASALVAIIFIKYLPQGDLLMGRGFRGTSNNVDSPSVNIDANNQFREKEKASSYWSVFADRKTCILCSTGFFFHFANANVLLVLGELMGGDNEDGSTKRSAIPLISGAIVLAQATMTVATLIGDKMTVMGFGRKAMLLAGLMSLPTRCALIIYWKDAGDTYLLSTQILDGLGGGFFGLLHPYIVADITFGTGRFNVVMGLTASCFGLGGTMSNYFGQVVVEKLGHVASLSGSLIISIIPVILFGVFMPETIGKRGGLNDKETEQLKDKTPKEETSYAQMT
mmetsp:Transcript_17060/g.16484  ORF Transcript_17060/g.16484 Transcript_17060/m.16484 type:complete len:455 (-) Transcript_17060:21-1385(-)|eukprot:CAMPEP_0197835738 /NCGR_PEP_ID=MMETSP1437-20131217/26787_1 /TAXON_ID=49252 ORGANISM="Eucampia antarctica, Strain CCMP1452" /NCGR_SAMPLE_ID=MMETSP1437 /ASSEMBLY_ACC=CAM_ASM_001096 /LENGTH=454 /DNA_ID=CAMNT_0043441391 /DNA_START=198 /DNA_END=1562 /DNA_ORIENTATION=+